MLKGTKKVSYLANVPLPLLSCALSCKKKNLENNTIPFSQSITPGIFFCCKQCRLLILSPFVEMKL